MFAYISKNEAENCGIKSEQVLTSLRSVVIEMGGGGEVTLEMRRP
jgi:hypothetical protein